MKDQGNKFEGDNKKQSKEENIKSTEIIKSPTSNDSKKDKKETVEIPFKQQSNVLPASTSGIDAHPYARGSVIEVLHGHVEKEEDVFWWSDSSNEDHDGEENEEEMRKDEEKIKNEKEKSVGIKVTIRLCDIIDRVSAPNGSWRYYVHYRDFNRRMDEWIGIERIASPPSIGNAKARALKKQEDKLKRKLAKEQQLLEEEQILLKKKKQSRANRRGNIIDPMNTASAEDNTPRMTRRQRRKTDDIPSLGNDRLSSLEGNKKTSERPLSPTTISHDHQIVKMISSTAAAETTKIGDHVVATIPAQELDEHEGLDEASLREHEEVTKVKNVSYLELGEYRMETWYFSPLPKELLSERGYVEILYVCEFSFNMFARKSELLRFQARELPKNCRHPPGNEIYRNGKLSMFEVDGFEERIYCQNLCYIAKLFLDHKTLYFDVDPFLFYVLCEVDDRGFHPVGYYSKEKYSDVGYNLACILTFPSHQRKGYGRFLIAFSYELTKKEEKVGSPEKPMSDLGQQAYKPYWMSTIVEFLLNQANDVKSISIMDISKKTSIMAEDIVFTLNQLGILKIIGEVYFIAANESLLHKLAKKHPVKEPRVDASKLHWTAFITDVKRDKFSIHSKKPSLENQATVSQEYTRNIKINRS